VHIIDAPPPEIDGDMFSKPLPAAQQINMPTKLAVIGAAFFSYTDAVVAEFAARGIEVVAFDEKHSNRKSAKIMYRLGLGFAPFSPLPGYHDKVANDIIAAGIPDVLLLGVEVISRAFVEKLVEAGVRVHLHMWDGRDNQGGFQNYLDLLSSCSTFDARDAAELDLAYIPLFAESLFAGHRAECSTPRFDIGFCGTMHSLRGEYISRLVSAPWAKRFRFGLMLYYHSRGLFLAKALVQWRLLKLVPRVSGIPFSRADVAGLFAQSRYVLDIPHPRQTGLTSRTFEALLAGARLLTFSKDAPRLLPPSLAARVVVAERIDDLAGILATECDPLPPLSGEERYYLSLARYGDDLLGQMTKAQAKRRAQAWKHS
jgi:hypothetical protein